MIKEEKEPLLAAGYHWTPQDCPICRSAPTHRLGRRGGSAHRQAHGVECEVWRCGRCDLIFPNPMPYPAGGLEQHYGMDADDYFRNHDVGEKAKTFERVLGSAAELLGGAGGRILDIGAGRGELLRVAAAQGWSGYGIEPSSTFAAYARGHSGAEIREEPVEACAFATGYFDAVVMSAVLEHLYNPDETIAEISRILRPGGVLLVDVPNEQGLYHRLGNVYQKLRGRDWVVNLSPSFPPYHTFGFSPRSLRALLGKHALKPVLWRVYAAQNHVPAVGAAGAMERIAAGAVLRLSRFGQLGTYIETWAQKAS